jgi:alcohol dehydrogenase, propanol-preferring
MLAMLLEHPKTPLKLAHVDIPTIDKGQVLIKVHACGICRTDLHVVDGELPHPKLPLVPGHQIIGKIVELGKDVKNFKIGDRVGVPWLGGSCGHCKYCLSGRENLCDDAVYTGYQINGGFAEYCSADSRFIFPIPEGYSDIEAAPLLCAGLIGYRALRMIDDARSLGFYGFGASAHILTQVARYQNKKVYAFTKKGDHATQKFAKGLGAVWAGDSETSPPEALDAAIVFAPVGSLVPTALRAIGKGGTVVCAGIHMSDIPSFPYSILWEERILRSVANLTRQDGRAFLELAPKIPVKTQVTVFPLQQANEALQALRNGEFEGAGVIAVATS